MCRKHSFDSTLNSSLRPDCWLSLIMCSGCQILTPTRILVGYAAIHGGVGRDWVEPRALKHTEAAAVSQVAVQHVY